MITITRQHARCLRGVFRRSVLGIGHRGPIPPLVLHAEGTQLRAQHRYAALAVEHLQPGANLPHEVIALPLDALTDVEGHDESPVVLESVTSGRTVARWEDHGVPQSRGYDVPLPETVPLPLGLPSVWADGPPGLLTALAAASATAADSTTRYALDCLQLRGTTHELIATDGRQLLVESDMPFPWDDDVLIRRSPVFAARGLSRDRPTTIGRTATHVTLRTGPWTLALEIQTEARFPAITHVLPDPSGTATRLRLDPADAARLAEVLERMPGADEFNAPATLDLNGRVALRVQPTSQDRPSELVLVRSTSSGVPVRLSTNRNNLARAIRLGFVEIEIVDAESPLVCRAGSRTFAWQPLNQDSALAPSDHVIRIDSTASSPGPIRRSERDSKHPRLRSERNPRSGAAFESHPPAPVHRRASAISAGDGPCLAELIQEAIALHQALGDAHGRMRRLTTALRHQRKRERRITATLDAYRPRERIETINSVD